MASVSGSCCFRRSSESKGITSDGPNKMKSEPQKASTKMVGHTEFHSQSHFQADLQPTTLLPNAQVLRHLQVLWLLWARYLRPSSEPLSEHAPETDHPSAQRAHDGRKDGRADLSLSKMNTGCLQSKQLQLAFCNAFTR